MDALAVARAGVLLTVGAQSAFGWPAWDRTLHLEDGGVVCDVSQRGAGVGGVSAVGHLGARGD